MSGKKSKLIRRNVRKSTNVLFAEMTANIIRMPFKKRLALSWLILKGVRSKNRKIEE